MCDLSVSTDKKTDKKLRRWQKLESLEIFFHLSHSTYHWKYGLKPRK